MVFGLARDRGMLQGSLRRMEGIKFTASKKNFWIWALPVSLWLSQNPRIPLGSWNMLSWKFHSKGRIGKAKKKKKNSHPKTCLGINHSWNPLSVRYLLPFKANKAFKVWWRKWIFLEVSSCKTFVTLRPMKHSWAPLRSGVNTNLCWGGFWMLEFAFLCCCRVSFVPGGWWGPSGTSAPNFCGLKSEIGFGSANV